MRTNKYNFDKYRTNLISNFGQINEPITDNIIKNPSQNNKMKKSVTLEVNLPIDNYLKYNYMNNPNKKNNNMSSRINTHSFDYFSPIFYKSNNGNNYIHYINERNDNASISRTAATNMNNTYKTSNNVNNIRINNYLKDLSNNDSLLEQQEPKKANSKQKNKVANSNINKLRNKSARNKKYYSNNMFNSNNRNALDDNYFDNYNNNTNNNKKGKNNLVNTNINKRNYLYNYMNKKQPEFISNDFINDKINFNNINIGINNNNFIIDNNKSNKKYDNNDSIELNLVKGKSKENFILKTENDLTFKNNRSYNPNYLGDNIPNHSSKYKTSLSENKYKIPLYHSQNLTKTSTNNYLNEDSLNTNNNNNKKRNLSNKNKINKGMNLGLNKNSHNINIKKNINNKISNPTNSKSEKIINGTIKKIQKDNYKNRLENIQTRMKNLLNIYSYLLSNKVKIEYKGKK